MLPEKTKNVLRYVVGIVCSNRVGVNPNPNNHGAKSLLLVLSIGEEASGIDRIAFDPCSCHQLANFGTDSAPCTIEKGVVYPMERLGRLKAKSATGLGPGIFC